MKKTIFSLFIFGAVLSASSIPVSFVSATGPVGPYTLSVDGQNVQAMCMDDFLTVGGKWNANETAVSSTSLGNTYLGSFLSSEQVSLNGKTLTTGDVYSMEAYLFNDLIQQNADGTDIQEAAWALMDPSTLSYVEKHDSAANSYLTLALNNYSSFNTSGYEIISEVNPGWSSEQEFMIKTSAAPEPASFALFGAGLLAAGAARFFRRKNQVAVIA